MTIEVQGYVDPSVDLETLMEQASGTGDPVAIEADSAPSPFPRAAQDQPRAFRTNWMNSAR